MRAGLLGTIVIGIPAFVLWWLLSLCGWLPPPPVPLPLRRDPLLFPGGDSSKHRAAAERARRVRPLELDADQLLQTNRLTLAELKRRFGTVTVMAQQSSRTDDDMVWGRFGGLTEVDVRLGAFISSILDGDTLSQNYVKLVDDNPLQRPLDGAGSIVEAELRAALARRGVVHARSLHWSLWAGANGSVTSMHKDYQRFTLLHVVDGGKRVVLIDPAFEFPCVEQPRDEPVSCWTHLDILGTPPPYAHVTHVRPGQTLVIPTGYWHAVENLGPTLAWGLNEFDPVGDRTLWHSSRWGGSPAEDGEADEGDDDS